MKIILDRDSCNCWDGACESCFGWRLQQLMEKGEMHPSSCHISAQDDGQPSFTFHIHDRDGKDKRLVINQDNWAEAYESWLELLARQTNQINH